MDELEAWLAESYPMAFRTACLVLGNRADAEEAVQEAFLRVWRFRASIPDGDGRKRWLYRVVVNACISRQRHAAARPQAFDDDGLQYFEASDADSDPSLSAETSALAGVIRTALEELPEHLRITVVLRYFSGLSEKEIATAIGKRPGTVKSRLHEARSRLADDPALAGWARELPARYAEESR